MKFIVLEIQTNSDETIGTIINSYTDRNQAEQQYHLILASAAVSSLPAHAAVLMTSEGAAIERKVYLHGQELEAIQE